MSIPCFSASFRAVSDGRTWNPIIIAFEAVASVTSESDICPTALCIMFTCISSVDSSISESDNASTDPSTSPLTIILSSWKLPIAIRRPISSSVRIFCVRIDCSLANCSRLLAIERASCSLSRT